MALFTSNSFRNGIVAGWGILWFLDDSKLASGSKDQSLGEPALAIVRRYFCVLISKLTKLRKVEE